MRECSLYLDGCTNPLQTLSPEILKQKSGPQMSTMELIKSPGVPTSLLAFGYASMLAFGFTAGKRALF